MFEAFKPYFTQSCHCLMPLQCLFHSAIVKFLPKFPIPSLRLWLYLLPYSPFLGLSKCSSDSEPLPMQFLLPEIPVPDNGTSPSFLPSPLFSFCSNVLFSVRGLLYLTYNCTSHTHTSYSAAALRFSSKASFAFLLSISPHWTINSMKERVFVFILWCVLEQ